MCVVVIIRKYKKFLKDYYQDPLPHDDKLFNRNNPDRKRGYVELAIIEKNDETLSTDLETEENCYHSPHNNTVALKDILKKDDDKQVRLVLIEGTSGIGKSTLAWQVCHKWAKLDSDKDFKLVVLVRLRKERAQKPASLEDLLPYDENDIKIKELTSAIGRGKGVLIVCDGFDELSCKQQKNPVYVKLFSGRLLSEATVIVTTHPSASAHFKRVCERNIHRELEIIGFTETGIIEFAKSIFKIDTFGGFLKYITSNPSIYSMMYLPLSAVIVAKIYKAHGNRTNTPSPKTMSELFESFTLTLLRRHLESMNQDDNFVEFKMPSSISKLPSKVASSFFEIAKIAYNGICKNVFVFNDLDESDFDHLGLMRRVSRENEQRGHYITYVFFHRALQEYMAALHIANNLSSLLASSSSQAKKLHKQLEEKDMITRFLAGICGNNQLDYSNDLLQWFIKFLSRICFDRSRALQLVHCAYECPSIMERFGMQVPKSEKPIVVLPEVGIDWYAMGYCISHFGKKWGLHTTSLRKENLDLLQEGLNSLPSTEEPDREGLNSLPSTEEPGREGLNSLPPSNQKRDRLTLSYLHISKSEVSVSQVITSLGELCRLECLELINVNIDEEDKEALKQLIEAEGGLKSLTYRTVNEYTHTRSLIPMLLGNSSLEKLVVRTGSVVNMGRPELDLPHSNSKLKKLTISCELVQPLKALLPNTSLTHLVVDTQVYDSDLPFLTTLVESHSTLQVLKLGKIADFTSNPKPTYASLTSASRNLGKLVEVANSQLKKLKLHKEDYDYLPTEYHKYSTVCSR